MFSKGNVHKKVTFELFARGFFHLIYGKYIDKASIIFHSFYDIDRDGSLSAMDLYDFQNDIGNAPQAIVKEIEAITTDYIN